LEHYINNMHLYLIHITAEIFSCYTSTVTSQAPTQSGTSAPSPSFTRAKYMDTVDEWRAKLGLPALTQNATLEANALKTCIDGKGQMIHELNPGSLAQVLAPGDIGNNFEHIFVGGWLCEKPDMAGMNGACANLLGWYHTTTGHADILTSTIYKKIGCASSTGVTSCDLA
jgi:uncharacterized protein YkwD